MFEIALQAVTFWVLIDCPDSLDPPTENRPALADILWKGERMSSQWDGSGTCFG